MTRAFTLLELLIVLAIAGSLMALAAPNFQQLLTQHRLSAASVQLRRGLRLARILAIKENHDATFCAKAPNISCGTNWQQGQLIIIKDMAAHHFAPLDVHITWRGSFGRTQLIFTPEGYTRGTQGTFTLSLHHQHIKIVVSRTGRIRLTT